MAFQVIHCDSSICCSLITLISGMMISEIFVSFNERSPKERIDAFVHVFEIGFSEFGEASDLILYPHESLYLF